jgi:hypothetical protein
MNTKIYSLIIALLILTSCSWFGNKEITVPVGIAADSVDYEQYASCVAQCDVCESKCMDTAYYNKAMTEKESTMCDRITSESVKTECKNMLLAIEAVSELNKDKCMQLNEAEQNSCFVRVSAEIAIQSQSVDKCAESPDVEHCQNIFYKDMAIMNNDTTYCDNLNDEKKQMCYDSLI